MLVSPIAQKGFTDISINLSKSVSRKSLRKETPQEVKKRVDAALADIQVGDQEHLVIFNIPEFEAFSQALTIK